MLSKSDLNISMNSIDESIVGNPLVGLLSNSRDLVLENVDIGIDLYVLSGKRNLIKFV